MAQTTTAALQAALNTITGHGVGSPDPIKILQEVHDSATYSRWYCVGTPTDTDTTPQDIYGERAMWCRTTVANTAANQAAEIIAAMKSDANVDPDAQA